MRLISKSPVSLYNQLKEILIERIKNGTYLPGSFIASEAKIIKEFGVSITTVRKTINDLVSMGLLEKIHGKGTRVISKEVRIDISSVHSLSEDVKRLGFKYQRQVLEYGIGDDFPDSVKTIFNIGRPGKLLRLKRLNFIGSAPSALIYNYFPEDLEIKANEDDFLNNSIYEIFKRSGFEIIREDWKIKADMANRDVSNLLEIDNKTPVMMTDVVYYDKKSTPVMVSKEYLRSDKFYISLVLNKTTESFKDSIIN